MQEHVYVAESADAGRGETGTMEVPLHDIAEPAEEKTPQGVEKRPQPTSKWEICCYNSSKILITLALLFLIIEKVLK